MVYKLNAQIQLFLLALLLSMSVSIKLSRDHVDHLIQYFDRSPQDGSISINEMDCERYLENDFQIALENFEKADKNGDGYVNKEEMSNLMVNFFEYINQPADIIPSDMEIDPKEMKLAAKNIAEKVSDKMLEAIRGGTHMPNLSEIAGILYFMSTANLTANILGFYDGNEDWSISKAQIADLPKNCQLLKIIMQNAEKNANGDGKLDREEFLKYLDMMEKGGHKEL